jgi:hypothetical protein
MKNKNKYPINGTIIEDISVRTGVHQYDEKNRTVVELTFYGYNSSYVQVIDMRTAADLIRQLREQGIAQGEKVTADEVFAGK